MDFLDWLSGFDEVVLCFDGDEAGKKAASDCAPLFKPGQCKIATLPLKDANEMLQAGKTKELIDCLWSAKEYRPDGIVLGTDLWAEVSKEEDAFSLSYPWQGLQASTHGCRLGELVTLTAGSGIGKSAVVRTLAHHLLVNHSEKVGMLMFEETVKRTALGLMGIHMKKPLSILTNPSKEEGFERFLGSLLRVKGCISRQRGTCLKDVITGSQVSGSPVQPAAHISNSYRIMRHGAISPP